MDTEPKLLLPEEKSSVGECFCLVVLLFRSKRQCIDCCLLFCWVVVNACFLCFVSLVLVTLVVLSFCDCRQGLPLHPPGPVPTAPCGKRGKEWPAEALLEGGKGKNEGSQSLHYFVSWGFQRCFLGLLDSLHKGIMEVLKEFCSWNS